MHVMHIINNLNRGGAETLLLRLCKGLHEQNSDIQCSVLILEPKYDLLKQYEEANIPVELVEVDTVPGWRRPFLLAKKIREIKPDVVHTHLLKSDRIGQVAAFLAGVKKRVATIHNIEAGDTGYDKTTRRLTNYFASKIITVSEGVRAHYATEKVYADTKMETIHNIPGFDSPEVAPRTKYRSPLRLIHVGRLHEQKGQIELLQAVKKLRDSGVDCTLLIRGEGDLRPTIEEEIARLGLSEVVSLPGTTETILDDLLEADIFVASSKYEGFNMALLEAMSAGLPVVATPLAPHKELLGKSYQGFAQIEDFAEMLQTVIKDFEKMSSTVLQRAEHFSYTSCISKYEILYTDFGKKLQ